MLTSTEAWQTESTTPPLPAKQTFNPCSRPIVSGWPTQCIGQIASEQSLSIIWQLPETIRFQTVELTLNIPSSIEMVSTFILQRVEMLVRVSLLVRQRCFSKT